MTLHQIKIFLVLFFGGFAVSQASIGLSNPRAMAMAGAYSGIGLGAEAALANPANLSQHNNKSISILLFQIGGFIFNDAFNKDYYDRYNGAYLDAAAKEDILNAIPRAGVHFIGRVDAQPLAVSYGPFAFSILFQAGASGWLNKEMFELMLQGNELERVYQFEPLVGHGLALTSYVFSYGQAIASPWSSIQHLGLGINLKYLRGHHYSEVKNIQLHTVTHFTATTAAGYAQFRTAQGGDGFGADLGLTATFLRRWRASLVLENLFGQLSWSRKPEEIQAEFTVSATTVEKIVSDDLDFEQVVISHDTTLSVPGFRDRLPLTVRFGLVRGFKRLFVAVEIEKSVKNSALTNEKPLFAIGAEYQAWTVLRLRSGARFGGNMAPSLTGGLGLVFGALRWDIAILSIAGLAPDHMKGLGFATGLVFKY